MFDPATDEHFSAPRLRFAASVLFSVCLEQARTLLAATDVENRKLEAALRLLGAARGFEALFALPSDSLGVRPGRLTVRQAVLRPGLHPAWGAGRPPLLEWLVYSGTGKLCHGSHDEIGEAMFGSPVALRNLRLVATRALANEGGGWDLS